MDKWILVPSYGVRASGWLAGHCRTVMPVGSAKPRGTSPTIKVLATASPKARWRLEFRINVFDRED